MRALLQYLPRFSPRSICFFTSAFFPRIFSYFGFVFTLCCCTIKLLLGFVVVVVVAVVVVSWRVCPFVRPSLGCTPSPSQLPPGIFGAPHTHAHSETGRVFSLLYGKSVVAAGLAFLSRRVPTLVVVPEAMGVEGTRKKPLVRSTGITKDRKGG